MTLEQLIALLLTTALGWLAKKVQSFTRLELELGESRKSQGERLGLLEDRVSRLEGALGARKEQQP